MAPFATSRPADSPLTTGALALIGLLTATPALALVAPDQLASYGVVDPDAVTTTLLQHRGALQLVLGGALVWAAVRPDVRRPVVLAAVLAKGVFLGLTLARPQVREDVSPVALTFDAVSIAVLLLFLRRPGILARDAGRAA
ncbi:hypothetical protein GCM10027055_20410 [Janibacter alkaliphilus]|uniref:DUF4345 domain-containing protein n=1 Tax=Janibacter alkaliphilus TaxID=1069963 RepID=A0A852XK09_9MICO|nr:hypothetical protein [Janibacter alkaliphilus]NYG38651.1 hypothetical protein [Janibacter alkaliphilus]